MGWKWYAALAVMALILGACGGEGSGPHAAEPAELANSEETEESYFSVSRAAGIGRSLEELAELERSGSYVQGMGLAESGLRENAGDYAGAVLAAFKELDRAYGAGLIQKEPLEEGLAKVAAMHETGGEKNAVRAAEAVLAFMHGRWDEAGAVLRSLFDEREEPDSFARWMILVCDLEKNRDDKRAAEAYRSIRARYTQFPEYWYRGAMVFKGAIAAEYAEQCITIAPVGPFAGECRNILASFAGLSSKDSASLKSKFEIEVIITRSVNQGNPEILSSLIPLISLPDNPYTIYALGALRALAALPSFRDYFSALASDSQGRLAERLAYICRG